MCASLCPSLSQQFSLSNALSGILCARSNSFHMRNANCLVCSLLLLCILCAKETQSIYVCWHMSLVFPFAFFLLWWFTKKKKKNMGLFFLVLVSFYSCGVSYTLLAFYVLGSISTFLTSLLLHTFPVNFTRCHFWNVKVEPRNSSWSPLGNLYQLSIHSSNYYIMECLRLHWGEMWWLIFQMLYHISSTKAQTKLWISSSERDICAHRCILEPITSHAF